MPKSSGGQTGKNQMKTIKKFEVRSRRVKVCEAPELYDVSIKSPTLVSEIARQLCLGLDQEVFLVFFLASNNKVIGYEEVAKGSIDECPVDPRVIFRIAVHLGVSAIVIAHNHPSGSVEPSPSDIDLTKRIRECGELLRIQVLDHVIVSDLEHYSFAEHFVGGF